jgi:hypothetical protein
MKCETTKKYKLSPYKPIIALGYGTAQYLLRHQEPINYIIGSSGWECEFYDTPKAIISIGYRPIGKYANYAIVDKFNESAKDIIRYSKLEATDLDIALNNLLLDCINELLGGEPNA